MDLGSAKDDLNSKLTVMAMNAAFASSEDMFKSRESQLVFPKPGTSFGTVCFVPPLSTSHEVASGMDSLQGSHFEPGKKGIMEFVLKGEIPKIPAAAADDPDTPAVDFITEIRPKMIGLLKPSPRNSPARVE